MLGNWIRQTTTSTGTGALTLASVTNYPTFAQEFGINQPFYYTIVDDTTLAPIESGVGKMTSSTSMARIAVYASMVSGTYTGAGASAVSLPAGTYRVICTGTKQAGGASALPGINSSAAVRAKLLYPYIGAGNNKALSANTPVVLCGRIEAGKGLISLGVEVTTLGGTSSDKIRLGVYGCYPDGSIGDLVCQSGDMLPNTTGVKSASIVGGTIDLPPAWYYVAILSSVAVTLRATNGGNAIIAQTTPLGRADGQYAYSFANGSAVGSGWSAMPTNITLSSLVSMGTDYAPAVHVYL